MKGTHALIIDDESSNIDVLAMLLRQEGISHTGVLLLNTLAEQLDQLTQTDLIFLDMELPNANYLDLLQELRERFPGARIIAYTVHISEADKARRDGFDGFLGKPLRTSDFPRQIQRIMNGESVWEY